MAIDIQNFHHSHDVVKGKVVCTLASKTSDECESEMKVSDDCENYFSDKSDTKTINSVAPDELLDNSVSLWNFNYMLTMIPKKISFVEKNRRKLQLHLMYKHHQYGVHLKKVKPFNLQFCTPNTLGMLCQKKNSNSERCC